MKTKHWQLVVAVITASALIELCGLGLVWLLRTIIHP